MPERVAIITDSTAYLPDGLAEQMSVTVVPLHVVLDGVSWVEGVDVTPSQVAAALIGRRTSVTTSQPSPTTFLAAYRAALAAGATSVVSVHLSAELSGTVHAAGVAAEEVGPAVRVVDSRSTAMGLGFAVLAAAGVAAAGGDAEAAVAAARETAARTTTMFYVDTLEHLRRGGRIGAAQKWLGTALAVKPLLHVVDGRIVPLEKVRTTARAIARLEELVVLAADGGQVDLAVQHLAASQKAAELTERLTARLSAVRTVYLSEVGAVVGAHVGPGLLGVVIVRC
ncbi:MAG: DegV family protein [Geodermatophilaceae bacterium]|nr:DegV family protein [Geodermatophilaceae bacterium]